MKLETYLAASGIEPPEFARTIGVKPITINRYINGERIPHKDEMARIFAATAGAVTPNDFYPIVQPVREHAG